MVGASSSYLRVRARAKQTLAGPPVPPRRIQYLRDWLYQLHGRSGLGMSGFARLSHLEIEAWARLRGIAIRPHEVEALLHLDDVMLAPPTPPSTAARSTTAGNSDGGYR